MLIFIRLFGLLPQLNFLLLDFLKQNSEFGYNFQNSSIISLPYADNFNLITTNKQTHQRLLNKLTILTNSMNLKLKPSKCSSTSIVPGSPKNIPFTLSHPTISTLFDKQHKYPGSVIGHSASSSAGFDFLHNRLSSLLPNIDASLVRPEFKLKTMPPMLCPRFVFTSQYTILQRLNCRPSTP